MSWGSGQQRLEFWAQDLGLQELRRQGPVRTEGSEGNPCGTLTAPMKAPTSPLPLPFEDELGLTEGRPPQQDNLFLPRSLGTLRALAHL